MDFGLSPLSFIWTPLTMDTYSLFDLNPLTWWFTDVYPRGHPGLVLCYHLNIIKEFSYQYLSNRPLNNILWTQMKSTAIQSLRLTQNGNGGPFKWKSVHKEAWNCVITAREVGRLAETKNTLPDRVSRRPGTKGERNLKQSAVERSWYMCGMGAPRLLIWESRPLQPPTPSVFASPRARRQPLF